MEFGVFDHLDRGSLPLRDYYEARLELIEAYDRAGFHAYHVAEHHATPLGMAPSPSIFLAAAAQRTRRLRLGTLVYALPLHHPLRMIEEICLLDHLSRGRLDMGFGRGSSPIELEYQVWHKSFHHLFRHHGRVAKISGGEADFDQLHARGKGVAGTPDKVLQFLQARLGKAGANYCINRFAFGNLSLAESLRSVELFVRDVQPALQHAAIQHE